MVEFGHFWPFWAIFGPLTSESVTCGVYHAPLISPGIGPIYGASGLICSPRAYMCTLLCTLLQAAGGAAGECFPILWEPPSWPKHLAFGLHILGAHSQARQVLLHPQYQSPPCLSAALLTYRETDWYRCPPLTAPPTPSCGGWESSRMMQDIIGFILIKLHAAP